MPFDGTDYDNDRDTDRDTRELKRQTLERLRFAREQIAIGRWCQSTLEDDITTYRCAVGWVRAEVNDPAGVMEPASVFATHLLWWALPPSAQTQAGRHGFLGDQVEDIGQYNDQRTRPTIVKLFDRAIALVGSRQHAEYLLEKLHKQYMLVGG
jgi:hypothetical protein